MVLTSDPYRSPPPVASVDFAIVRSWFSAWHMLALVACVAVFWFGARFAVNRVVPLLLGIAFAYVALAGFIT